MVQEYAPKSNTTCKQHLTVLYLSKEKSAYPFTNLFFFFNTGSKSWSVETIVPLFRRKYKQ